MPRSAKHILDIEQSHLLHFVGIVRELGLVILRKVRVELFEQGRRIRHLATQQDMCKEQPELSRGFELRGVGQGAFVLVVESSEAKLLGSSAVIGLIGIDPRTCLVLSPLKKCGHRTVGLAYGHEVLETLDASAVEQQEVQVEPWTLGRARRV